MMEPSKNIRQLILYHYRRAQISEGTTDFRVLLEKDGRRVLVGTCYEIFDTGHKPRDIYALLEQGWKLVGVMSCFSWCWWAYRYVSWDGIKGKRWEEDYYGRTRIQVEYVGYSTKYDVFEEDRRRRYHSKHYICSETLKETIKSHVPDSVENLFDPEGEWMEELPVGS